MAARARDDWAQRYALRLFITDLVLIVWVVVGAQLLRFGVDGTDGAVIGKDQNTSTLSYDAISVGLILVWSVTLAIFGTRDARIVGAGSTEYRRVIDATLRLFGIAAILLFLFKVDISRAYVLIAFPVGLVLLLLSRWLWRQWLTRQRRRGRDSYRVVVAGSSESVQSVVREFARNPGAGYRVVAAAVRGGGTEQTLPGTGIPLAHGLEDLDELMAEHGADTLVLTGSDDLPPGRVRELSWQLEPGREHLVVAPSLTDISGPRLHMRPIAGLSLVHVETPQYEGAQRFSKRAFDLVGALLAVIVLSPALLAIAIAVGVSSRGGVLFAQRRVGLAGEPFRMLKFRSMVPDAEQRLAGLAGAQDAGNEVLFKLRDDPRVTPVGHFLRRTSLDELPQLFNVIAGSMSLVGPRPPLEREVESYQDVVHRRFLVKPGITGLWQVSGRSSLSWEESVRLDLDYVENWSMTGDLLIVMRTLRAVVRGEGAY